MIEFAITIAVAAALGQPPDFPPMRGHEWGDTIDEIRASEALQPDSAYIDGEKFRYQNRQTLQTGEGVLGFSLDAAYFNGVAYTVIEHRLVRMILAHEPRTENDAWPESKVIETFDAIRNWVRPPESDDLVINFKSSVPELSSEFAPGRRLNLPAALADKERYTVEYRWCNEERHVALILDKQKRTSPRITIVIDSPEIVSSKANIGGSPVVCWESKHFGQEQRKN